MINLLLGASGGGKSYEAVRYHILPALEQGRKVITNLPLNIEAFAQIDATYRNLIIKRTKPQTIQGNWTPTEENPAFLMFSSEEFNQQPKEGSRSFGGVWDYWFDDSLKNETGQGPLFVIDECQLPLPYKSTDRSVEEWYSLHRHFNVDVLLITQSYGKISQAIRDNVQIVYRVRKNIALGSTKSYTRKVQDGLRGEVVNTSVRQYDSKIFPLYKSHTQGQAAQEFNASDIVPLWKRWPFIGAALAFTLFAVVVYNGDFHNPMKKANEISAKSKDTFAHKPQTTSSNTHSGPTGGGGPPLAGGTSTEQGPEGDDLLEGRGLHIAMHIKSDTGKEKWWFMLSHNGQGTGVLIPLEDLKQAGYTWRPYGECLGKLTGQGVTRSIACDTPTLDSTVGGVKKDSSQGIDMPPPQTTPPAPIAAAGIVM